MSPLGRYRDAMQTDLQHAYKVLMQERSDWPRSGVRDIGWEEGIVTCLSVRRTGAHGREAGFALVQLGCRTPRCVL